MFETKETARRLSEDELRAAVREANIPTLLVMLAHLSGDLSWIRGHFAPAGPRGMDDNDSAGLSDHLQELAREAAVRLVLDWRDEVIADPVRPSDEVLLELMSAQAGEPVGEEFLGMISEELGLQERGAPTPQPPAASPAATKVGREDFEVLVIGAGLGGVCAGIKLGEAGLPYRVVERNAEPGGTWSDNDYPGAGVDTPSHLYSYSFEQLPDWSRFYAKRAEINQYVAHCARKYGVYEHISFRTEATSARYDEASSRWIVELRHADGSTETVTPRAVISAVGQLNIPKIPDLPGMDDFTGPMFHTAKWESDTDLRGQRVAVVGTGASAMQLVPILAREVEELVIFQRSPQWAGPNDNYFKDVSPAKKTLFAAFPMYLQWYRFRLLWMFNDKVYRALQIDPEWPHPERSVNAINDRHRAFFTEHIVNELGDRQELLPDVLPTYPPFGKRMLIDNGWFAALTRPNVRLVTSGVSGFTESAVLTHNGEAIETDVVVLSTGFETLRLLGSVDVVGRAGRLRDVWGDEDGYAHLGISVPGFPNFFCVFGPNTNLGHGGSIIFNIECQVRYIVDLLTQLVDTGELVADCRPEVLEDYLDRVDEAHSRMIWSHPGFTSFYRNSAGRVVTNSPWRLVDYWRMTERADLADYRLGTLASAAPE